MWFSTLLNNMNESGLTSNEPGGSASGAALSRAIWGPEGGATTALPLGTGVGTIVACGGSTGGLRSMKSPSSVGLVSVSTRIPPPPAYVSEGRPAGGLWFLLGADFGLRGAGGRVETARTG